MGKLLNTIKDVIANKNTITILGVLIGVIAVYMIYNSQIQSTVKTVSVYYLKNTVTSNTQLKEDDLAKVTISSNITKTYKNLVTNLSQIQVTKGTTSQFYYVNYDHTLSAGQLLCKDDLVAPDEKLPSKNYNLPDGYKQFELKVDLDLTQGNSIAPGNSFDIYIQGKTEDDEIIFTKFIENLEVLDVVDNKWITTAGSESGSPKYLITTCDEDMWLLLNKAEKVARYNFKLIPVVKDKAYDSTIETKVVNESIKEIIEANTSYISY